MRFKTEGIIINYIKHRESSIITRIYTSRFGLQHYIVNSVRKPKPRYSLSLFQPLNLVDLVVYHKEHSGLNRIYEISCPEPFSTISYDVRKSTIALFITEILSYSLREEETNTDLFEFLQGSIRIFDKMQENFMNFHLQFLLKLTKYLGFGLAKAENLFIETFQTVDPGFFKKSDIRIAGELLSNSYTKCVSLGNEDRRRLLESIINYFTIHLQLEREIKSLSVLKSVFQ